MAFGGVITYMEKPIKIHSFFINDIHRERYLQIVTEDGMYPGDVERACLFYIISGNNDLYKKRRFIYNTREHHIESCLDNRKVDFSSGMRALIRLGFNLYNRWSDEYMTPMDLFGVLDERNMILAENAMSIRFDETFYLKLLEFLY